MKNKFVFLILFISSLSVASFVLADVVTIPNPLCLGGPGSKGCVNSFEVLITNISFYISTIIGSLAVLMFVISGIMFVASSGNPGRIESAKKTAIYAAVGAAIALSGAALVQVVKAVIGA